jgi:hypothetical protein
MINPEENRQSETLNPDSYRRDLDKDDAWRFLAYYRFREYTNGQDHREVIELRRYLDSLFSNLTEKEQEQARQQADTWTEINEFDDGKPFLR